MHDEFNQTSALTVRISKIKETGVLNLSISVTFAILRESTLDPMSCFILKLKEGNFLQLDLYMDIMIMTADILKELIQYRQE